ncbi:MAG: hypothetical protein KDD34_03725, partial [Bdellovibrionales bacterium]|nr:hypothetical protein [Bdellovibrionales bacterium]
MTTTQNLRQRFLQWKYAFALAIIFSTTTIGANDQLKYEKGVAPLKSRSEFCQYVTKSTNNFKTEFGSLETLPEVESVTDSFDHTLFLKVLSLKKSLAAYRNKKILFINLPTSLQKIIEEKKMSLTNQIFQVEKKIDVIHSKLSANTHLKRTPSAYQIWEKENEWPLHLKVLEDQKRNLTAEVDNLDKKLFGDQDIIELMGQVDPAKEEKLIIELKFENS